MKKAERQRIDAFELWCWRRLLRVPWVGFPRSTTQSFVQQMSSPNLAPRTTLCAEDTNVNQTKISALGDYPGGPVVKIPCFHCRGCGFDPNQGSKIPHAAQRVQKKLRVGQFNKGMSEQTQGDCDGQRRLECCSSCGYKEWERT